MLTEARVSRSNKLLKLDLQWRKKRGYNDGVTEKKKEIRKKKKERNRERKLSGAAWEENWTDENVKIKFQI